MDLVNQQILAMRRQLAALEEALARFGGQGQGFAGAHLGARLAAQRRAGPSALQELRAIVRTSSGVCGRCSARGQDIRVVVTASSSSHEVFFDAGQAVLKPEGQAELNKLADILLDLGREMPPDLPWILASTAIPTTARSRPRSSRRTGISPRRAPLPSSNI